LKSRFHNRILPLLQEYFYGDFSKIGLVLGRGFFDLDKKVEENIFADFSNDVEIGDLNERPVWKLKDISTMQPGDFKTAISGISAELKIAIENVKAQIDAKVEEQPANQGF